MPTAKQFPLLPESGQSDAQLAAHRDVLYQGYVKRLGEIESQLPAADRAGANAVFSSYRSLKVEEVFSLNGVILHELYFGNLGPSGEAMGQKTTEMITRDFGSVDAWKEDMIACGKSARGWALLAYSLYDGKLHNYVLDAHHLNVPALALPLLVVDVYEHAYMIDYGTDRAKYLADVYAHVRWEQVEKRVAWAEGLGAAQDTLAV